MAKTTSWLSIKKEYLEGVAPKELAVKYKIKAQAIYDKANAEQWKSEKSRIVEKTLGQIESKIDRISNKALDTCEKVMDDDTASYKDRLTAANIALSVSGLKTSKQEITGKDGTALIQRVYVTPDMQKEAEEFTKELLNG